MIERFVRASGRPVTVKTQSYMRVVTIIWCVFFAVNGIAATLIAVSGTIAAWTIYNGLVAYIVIGILIIGEFIVRYFYKRRHGLIAGRT
jgi:uncharacterized membrane protein